MLCVCAAFSGTHAALNVVGLGTEATIQRRTLDGPLALQRAAIESEVRFSEAVSSLGDGCSGSLRACFVLRAPLTHLPRLPSSCAHHTAVSVGRRRQVNAPESTRSGATAGTPCHQVDALPAYEAGASL